MEHNVLCVNYLVTFWCFFELTVSVSHPTVSPQAVVCCFAATVEERKRTLMDYTATTSGMATDNEKKKVPKMADGKEMAGGCSHSHAKKVVCKNLAVERDVVESLERNGGGATTSKMAVTAATAGEVTAGSLEVDNGVKNSVEVEGESTIPMLQLLKAVDSTCGRVLGCRSKRVNKWEMTMSNPRGKDRLLDGFKIGDSCIVASEVTRDTRIVSFLNLTLYVTDAQIYYKLTMWGVEPASPIKKKKWARTEVLDGTRFLKVRFTDIVTSLPYSTKFLPVEGVEYFRVLHDSQQKVCRLCLQPGHIIRECPDFRCFKCKENGHYACECTVGAERCVKCKDIPCSCKQDDTADMSGQDNEEEQNAAAVGGGEVVPESGEPVIQTAEESVVGETGVVEAEELIGSSDEYSGVPMVFQRLGRPVVRSSTPVSAGHAHNHRSRSRQQEESATGSAEMTAGQTRGRAGALSDSDLEDPAKQRRRGGKLSLNRGKKGT